MLYRLEHIREARLISARDFREAQCAYFYQWRDDDGSIPWRMLCGEYEINPCNGNILKGPLPC